MNYCKLRIAWSVGWGILCLLLLVLWVRSYWANDVVYYRSRSTVVQFVPAEGAVRITNFSDIAALPGLQMGIGWSRVTVANPKYASDVANSPLLARIFRAFDRPNNSAWRVPHWLILSLVAAIAATPWLRWRFSLRTLLIAMSVVAVGLATVVAMRRGY